MLSIGKIAHGQHRYYERQVARGEDDYYSGRGEAPGEWVGAGAGALGLSGRVSAGQFNALIAGLDPRERTARLRSDGRDVKVAAFDLTFSAPKSVSVLFAVAPEGVSGRLAGCHEEAVRAALGYLQDTAVMVRRGHGGEHVEQAEGLIAAAYRHRMSRALDPQLHTHVVAANLARGEDGRFTALHGAELYRAAKTAGYLYQAHLRALVSERLGLEWGEVHKGAAELADIPPVVLEHFSQRRHEMLRVAEAEGIALDSRAAGEVVALGTRERKQYGVQTHTWREEVRRRAAGQGLDDTSVELLLLAGGNRVHGPGNVRDPIAEGALAARLAGPEGLTEHANTFDERAVLREFAAAARRGAQLAEVRAQAQRFMSRGDVLATTRGEMTTLDLVAEEQRLIDAVLERAGEYTAVVDRDLAGRVIAASALRLTEEQAQAVLAVTSSWHGVSTIEALAGTGKTFTAGVLRDVYEAAGYTVLGVAPTGRAVRELAATGIAARTLDGALVDLERYGTSYLQGAVVIFDEAGMAGTRASARLLTAAHRAGAKVIPIGDPGQLSSVRAGGWLGATGRRLGTVRLTQVVRQRDPNERHALAALHDSDPHTYLRWAQGEGRIETFNGTTDARKHALALWLRSIPTPAHVPQSVMIARDNEQRDALNDAARERFKTHGLLSGERDYGTVQVAVGDRVICRRNDRLLDVDNGTRGTVTRLDAHAITITTDDGHARELPAAYVAEHVEHAYALTGHGMQGGTVESAIVLASPGDLTAGWSYTALSRARGSTHLLIHPDTHDPSRNEIAPPGHTERPTHTQLLDRVTQRMSERDSEDLAGEQLPAQTPKEPPPPGAWVTKTLGEQPENPHQREAWEKAINATTSYRARYDITTPDDALGPQPAQRGRQQRDYQRAQRAIERAQHRLHRTPSHPHEHDLGIGL